MPSHLIARGKPTRSEKFDCGCGCGGVCGHAVASPHGDPVVRLQRLAGNRAVTGLIQRLAGGEAPTHAPAEVLDELRSTRGRPLDPATRHFMEAWFGLDFEAVRIHRGAAAERSADAIHARAYAAGTHIVLGRNAGSPAHREGRAILAHELAHVAQQGAGSGDSPSFLEVAPRSSSLEREADAAARAVTSGNQSVDSASLSSASVQVSRQEQTTPVSTTETAAHAVTATEGNVSSIDISLASDKIDFHTSQGLFRYQLVNNGLYAGTFQATVAVPRPNHVEFILPEVPEGELFSFGWRLERGQPDPSTFFGAQTSVTINVSDEPAPELRPSQPEQAPPRAGVEYLTPEEAMARCAANDLRVKTFPIRFTRFGAAPISAERVGNQILVWQPLNSVWGNEDFRAQTRTLPLETFISGVLLDPNEIVRVHIYRPRWYQLNVTGSTEGDEEEEFCVTGEQMLQFAQASNRALAFNIALTGVDALTLFVPVGKGLQLAAQPLMRGGRILLVGGMLGLREAAPTALGGIASRTSITLIEEQAVDRVAGIALPQTVGITAVQATEEGALQLVAPQLGQSLASRGASLTLDVAGRTGLERTVEAGGSLAQSALAPGAPSSLAASPAGESVFQELGAELGTEVPGTTAVSRARNIYPDFEPVSAAESAGLQSVAEEQTARLSAQLGIDIPADRALSAPWVGRVRNRAGEIMSSGTSQGWLRNERSFWRVFEDQFGEDAALLGPNHTVTKELAERWGWPTSGPNNVVGQRLVHHHMENSSLVVAIPESLHVRLSGAIHAAPTVVGTP